MKESLLYRVVRPIITFLMKGFIRPKIINSNYIPKDGRIVLAGTHTSNLDSLLLMSSTKRAIHFLAKKELFSGIKGLIFRNMGLIAVDREKDNHNSLSLAINYLNDEKVIGIFPEGTTEKGRGLLPFKIGSVKMAHDTNSCIVPFIIKGKYRLFSSDLRIVFGRPFKVESDDLNLENSKFRDIIDKMLKEEL